MPDEREASTGEDTTLAVAGILYVGPMATGRSGIWVGPAAGWRAPRGISQWEHEVSFIPRATMTPALASALRATLPGEQIAPKRFPMAARAVDASPLLALAGNLAQAVQEQGIRVHTLGVDRVSGDFYYFEAGGNREPVRALGNLVEMLGPSLGAATTNAEIATLMDGLLDRLLLALSEGEVSELDVELANDLPRLARDGTGLVGTDIEAFEAESTALAARAARWDAEARRIPDALAAANRRGKNTTPVPLFGDATKEIKPALELLLAGQPLQLSAHPVWTVSGAPKSEEKPAPKAEARVEPAPTASPAPRAEERAVAKAAVASGPSVISSAAFASKVEERRTPTPAPGSDAKRTPSSSPRPVLTPSPSRVSTPAPARASVRPGSNPQGVKPTPLRTTPVPPARESTPPALSEQPAAPAPAPAPAAEPAPASVSLTSAPPPKTASDPAPAPSSRSRREHSSGRPSSPAPSSFPPGVPGGALARHTRKKKSPATTIVIVFAFLALAYIALRSFQ